VIDALLLLLNRAPFDYVKAAGTWLLTGRQRDASIDTRDDSVATTPSYHKPTTAARKLGYAVTGLVVAVLLGPLVIIGLFSMLTSIMSL